MAAEFDWECAGEAIGHDGTEKLRFPLVILAFFWPGHYNTAYLHSEYEQNIKSSMIFRTY
jgi:hypothetical protein